ncbi:MAG: hypothetical protein MUF54_17300, partial [Polyangiaceae bacterium]|nr:hypothetical protein [Polyangiaceae bacterium]
MLGRVLPCLTVAASASMLPACNPPILLEGKTGWQPRSEIYVVRYLEEPQREEPLPNSWALIDRREMHPALRT